VGSRVVLLRKPLRRNQIETGPDRAIGQVQVVPLGRPDDQNRQHRGILAGFVTNAKRDEGWGRWTCGQGGSPAPPTWLVPRPPASQTPGQRPDSRDLRYRRIKAFVDESCASFGSSCAVSSGTMRAASTFPSSTPHWSKESMPQIAPCVKTLCS